MAGNNMNNIQLPYRVKLLTESVPLYTGAGTEYVKLGNITEDSFDLEIAEERMGKGQKLWGKTEIRCRMDSSGKYGEDYYSELLKRLEHYFGRKEWKRLFLSGGCYWLARTLKQGIIDSVIMVNWTEEHCALAFGNGLYDVTGRISAAGFHAADENENRFMEKNYRPGFDTEKLEKYLAEK